MQLKYCNIYYYIYYFDKCHIYSRCPLNRNLIVGPGEGTAKHRLIIRVKQTD